MGSHALNVRLMMGSQLWPMLCQAVTELALAFAVHDEVTPPQLPVLPPIVFMFIVVDVLPHLSVPTTTPPALPPLHCAVCRASAPG